MKPTVTYSVLAAVPASLAALQAIAADVAWINTAAARELFREIDPHLADIEGLDPIGVLNRVSQGRLDELAQDSKFIGRAETTLTELQQRSASARWFQQRNTADPLRRVAYISAEYGLAASVPQYSGGLGVLAGDHLKAAADQGIPLVAIGLFYRHGYFRQQLDRVSRQVEQFPALSPAALRMERVSGADISIEFGETKVHAALWKLNVGTIPLYLLDTGIDSNAAPDQLVADRLYGGGSDQRIRQELLLGVGGLRALRALSETPEVFHLNEGHAGFLALELIREMMVDHGLNYDEAVEAVRPRIVFTTHTPVPAGIDRFPRALIESHFAWWCRDTGRTIDQLMELGFEPDGDPDTFNLAAMSLRLAGWAGGVSQLHGEVSREMFGPLWPGVATAEVPITSVTNGVHASTWVDDGIAQIFRNAIGDDWSSAPAERWNAMATTDEIALWTARNDARSRLIAFTRARLNRAVARRRGLSTATSWANTVLDPEALTIGFARRFATYKRATLMLRDLDRLHRLLTNSECPVQFVFAGKAHPADEPGKEYLRAIAALADDPELRSRVVFLEDYDIDAGRALTQGCDVWLNTPLRPMEACGTSGMKSAYNGGLNCSVLDGWWDEWFTPERGWAIPSADWIDDSEARDTAESDWLFDLFEREIVPLFYDRDDRGIPVHWIDRVRTSLAGLSPLVTADRMVRTYTTEAYEPAARRQRLISENSYERAKSLASARQRLTHAWPGVRILSATTDGRDPIRGAGLMVTIEVQLGDLTPSDVVVELVHGSVDVAGSLHETQVQAMAMTPDPSRDRPSDPSGDPSGDPSAKGATLRYTATITNDLPGSFGFTARIVPAHPDLARWQDLGLVTWSA